MTYGKKSDSDGDTTAKNDPISTALANVASVFVTLAERAQEASRRVRGLSTRERALLLNDICHAIRCAGDGAHDYARSIEQFLRG